MSFELDQEPFECEAFPGMIFVLRGDREAIHLCAQEEKHLGEVEPQAIIGIDRRGHLLKHPFRAMPLLTPASDGRIAAGATSPRAIPVAPNPTLRHPTLSATIGMFSDGDGVRVYAQRSDGNQVPLVGISSNGKIRRFQLSSRDVRTGRDMGFAFSADSAIAIHNPYRGEAEAQSNPPRSPNILLPSANAEGWRAYDGSGMPVAGDVRVEIWLDSFGPLIPETRSAQRRTEATAPADTWGWSSGGGITFYRIVGEQPQVEAEGTSLALIPSGTDTLTAAKSLRSSYRKIVDFLEANEEAINNIARNIDSAIDNGTEEFRHFGRMIDRLDFDISRMEEETRVDAESEDISLSFDDEDDNDLADPEE